MCSKNYDLKWGLEQVRDVWTKSFRPDPVQVPSDDEPEAVEEESAGKEPLHEDDFERAMRLQHEADLRASSKHAPADQLDEWLKETSVPYTPDDNFSQTGIFEYWHSKTSKYPDLARMWRQFHACPASGGGIERVFTAAGKQHDDLKKKTMDKTLESTLKAGLNTKLPTCDAEGVFHDDEGTYKNRK